jgi:F0F1-type ATP synthase gamma subunit
MSKRSPDATSPLTSPRLKHARMESPSNTQTLAMIPDKYLQQFHENLQDRFESFDMQNIDLTETNCIFELVHAFLSQFESSIKDRNLVIKSQFMATVKREPCQGQLLEILRKAAESPLNYEDLKVLLCHGKCFTLGWIRS